MCIEESLHLFMLPKKKVFNKSEEKKKIKYFNKLCAFVSQGQMKECFFNTIFLVVYEKNKISRINNDNSSINSWELQRIFKDELKIFQYIWSILSLSLLLGPLWPGVVIPVRVLSMNQRDLFGNYLYLIEIPDV